MQEIPAFSHVSLSAIKTLSLKICGFLSVWRFLLFSVCSWKPAVNKMSDFLTPGSCLHLSAFSSYLLAVTIGNKYNFPGVTSPLHAMCFQCRPDGEQCQRHLPPPWYKHRPKWGTWTSTPAFTCWYSVRGSLLKQKN